MGSLRFKARVRITPYTGEAAEGDEGTWESEGARKAGCEDPKSNREARGHENAPLTDWPGSQRDSSPGMFHPNPRGHLVNTLSRCAGGLVWKKPTRERKSGNWELNVLLDSHHLSSPKVHGPGKSSTGEGPFQK